MRDNGYPRGKRLMPPVVHRLVEQRKRGDAAEAALRQIEAATKFHREHYHDPLRNGRLVADIESALDDWRDS